MEGLRGTTASLLGHPMTPKETPLSLGPSSLRLFEATMRLQGRKEHLKESPVDLFGSSISLFGANACSRLSTTSVARGGAGSFRVFDFRTRGLRKSRIYFVPVAVPPRVRSRSSDVRVREGIGSKVRQSRFHPLRCKNPERPQIVCAIRVVKYPRRSVGGVEGEVQPPPSSWPRPRLRRPRSGW